MSRISTIIWIVVMYILIISLGYFTAREDLYQLLILFGIAFAVYFIGVKQAHYFGAKQLILIGLLLRVSMLVMTPNLSDDYWRFIWDGRLLMGGENPYLFLPEAELDSPIIEQLELNGEVFEKMNSRQYFTVYPPLAQVLYGMSSWFGWEDATSSVFALRMILILFELALFQLLLKLLAWLKKPAHMLAWYAFNPLVIIEVCGNLHFEGVMLFFTLGAVWLWTRKKSFASPLAMGLGIATKLLPAMFIPLWFRMTKFPKAFLFAFITGLTAVATFAPFVSRELIENMGSSVDLYFRSFEFNASIYYLIRELGEWITGYNQIAFIGPVLSVISLGIILWLSWRKRAAKNVFRTMLYCLSVYFTLTTTVHPWYIVSLVALAPLAGLRYPLIWSGLAILSYSHYQFGFEENYALISIEYIVLAVAVVRELRKLRPLQYSS